jgi:hypothetical protein
MKKHASFVVVAGSHAFARSVDPQRSDPGAYTRADPEPVERARATCSLTLDGPRAVGPYIGTRKTEAHPREILGP